MKRSTNRTSRKAILSVEIIFASEVVSHFNKRK